MDPKDGAPGTRHQAQQLVAPVGHVQISAFRQAVPDRRPIDPVDDPRPGAFVAHLDAVAARRQLAGQIDERGFDAAQGPRLGALAIEGDAVVGDEDAGH